MDLITCLCQKLNACRTPPNESFINPSHFLLIKYNGGIQAAVDALSTGPKNTVTFDDIPPRVQEAVTKLNVRFPHVPLSQILDAVHKHPQNLSKASEELTTDEEVNLAFTEAIGAARFATRIYLSPLSSQSTPAEVKHSLRGHARFYINDKCSQARSGRHCIWKKSTTSRWKKEINGSR